MLTLLCVQNSRNLLTLILTQQNCAIIVTWCSMWVTTYPSLHMCTVGQISKNNFIGFLVQMRTIKFAFKIIWPLNHCILKVWSNVFTKPLYCVRRHKLLFCRSGKQQPKYNFLGMADLHPCTDVIFRKRHNSAETSQIIP